MVYNRKKTGDIMSRLVKYQHNPEQKINELPTDIKRQFIKNFINKLNSYDYDSKTVMLESLDEIKNEVTKGLSHAKKDLITDMMLQGWTLEELLEEFGTSPKWIDYIYITKIGNDITFYR